MSIKKDQTENKSQLVKIATNYFKKKGFKINYENAIKEGSSGMPRHFDLIIQQNHTEYGVWVRDWNRTIGINVIITLDTASEDIGLNKSIMVGEKFSDHAKAYANRKQIELLTKQKIQSLR
ncbi:MAG: restriction endonuclease [Candidatus Bathyarchaeota archaeon]|nr:restriction endonuclease [Candidatus Termiticorpusculum sp.]